MFDTVQYSSSVTYLRTTKAPVRVKQQQIWLLEAVGKDGVCVGFVGDTLLMEDVFTSMTRTEVLEAVSKKISQMIKRIPVSVILTVIMFFVEIRRVFSDPMIIIHPSPVRVGKQVISLGQFNKFVLGIGSLDLGMIGVVHKNCQNLTIYYRGRG